MALPRLSSESHQSSPEQQLWTKITFCQLLKYLTLLSCASKNKSPLFTCGCDDGGGDGGVCLVDWVLHIQRVPQSRNVWHKIHIRDFPVKNIHDVDSSDLSLSFYQKPFRGLPLCRGCTRPRPRCSYPLSFFVEDVPLRQTEKPLNAWTKSYYSTSQPNQKS